MNSLLSIPSNILCVHIIFDYLDIFDIIVFDKALLNKVIRSYLHDCFKRFAYHPHVDIHNNDNQCRWMRSRRLKPVDISLNMTFDDEVITDIFRISSITLETLDLSRLECVTKCLLSSLLQDCTHLVDIDFSSLHEVDDELVSAIACRCPNLVTVRLQDTSVRDEGVRALSLHCHRITTLDLSSCDVGDSAIVSLAQGYPLMRELRLCNLPRVTPVGWRRVSHDFPALRTLALSRQSALGVRALCGGSLELRCLELRCVHGLTDADVLLLLHSISHIEELELSFNQLTDAALVGLSETSAREHLRVLKLAGLDRMCSGAGLRALGCGCPQLEGLHLSPHMDSEGVWAILAFKGLRQLHFEHGNDFVTDDFLAALSLSCPHLADVNFSHCPNLGDSGVSSLVRRCPIVRLVLDQCRSVSDRTCRLLSEVSHSLTELSVCNTGVTLEGLRELGRGAVCRALRLLQCGARLRPQLPSPCSASSLGLPPSCELRFVSQSAGCYSDLYIP